MGTESRRSAVVGARGGPVVARRSRAVHVLVAAVAVLAAVLAGCADDGGSTASTTSAPVVRTDDSSADDGTTSSTPTTDGSPSTTATTTTATTTTATTTTATTTTAPPPPPEPITLAFGGDLLLHQPVNNRAADYGRANGVPFDYRPMLDPMRPVLEPADLALCHLEVPVSPDGRFTGYPSFGAPTEIADAVAHAGYDGCSTASNHSLDRGLGGVVATLEALDRAGLRNAGTARGAWESGPGWYRLGEVDVAHLSYTYGFNGYRLPADAPWAANGIDPTRIRAEAADARAAGAELVVVSLHWGTEYRHQPDAYQRSIADQVLPGAEIDLVIGHHAHVVQPIEVVHDRYVVWGLGNQLSNQGQAPRRDGLTVVVTAGLGWDGRWHVSGVEAVPTWVDLATHRVLPVARTLADPSTPPELRAELEASHARTAAIIQAPATPYVTITPTP